MTPPKIVVGVDGSAHSTAALRWALEYAQMLHACVTAIYAWQFPLLSIPGAFTRDELETVAKQLLLGVISAVDPPPAVPLHTIVAEGDPRSALIAAARDATLLVLGARGRTPLIGLLLGSVSQTCAAAAPCPVVIVKIPHDTRPMTNPPQHPPHSQ
jgi:nucleotide-binding universal stress UspA family protein